MVAVFIHRRDLRFHDNLALEALRRSLASAKDSILHVFILHPAQTDPTSNPYFSQRAFDFMMRCVSDMGLRVLRANDSMRALESIKAHIDVIGFNTDHTPWAKRRDEELVAWCAQRGIRVVTAEDYTLFPRGAIRTGTGKHYEVFTPFYNRCMSRALELIPKPINGKKDKKHGHREEALRILAQIRAGEFSRYDQERDFPALDATTHLSVYLKFGCISVREAFWAMHGVSAGLTRQLIWREFCAHLVIACPHVLAGQVGAGPNQPLKNKDAAWKRLGAGAFARWCEGRTGVPLVDAAMRCMNSTGFMPNRCRMVVASYLTRNMGADWRLGEKYFATQLIDYDPASNSFGWQWAAGVGADAMPQFRVFNPWLQGRRFDPDGTFIKRWVPEKT